jgi:hypothetical protein
MGTAPVFASVSEAMEIVRAGLAFVAAADATGLSAEEQAQCLRGMEQANSVLTAARTSVLGVFTAGKGYAADADYSPRAWLMHKTGVTKGAAVSGTMWVKRAARHPEIFAALVTGEMSESYARTLCTWTDKLPADKRDEADKLLAREAAAGMGLRDLAKLAAEMLARCRPGEPDQDPGQDFDDRSVKVQTTFGGAGIIHGDLTPECASIVGTVLDALAGLAGAEDDRTKEQRYHDALQEAMRRLCFCIMMDSWTKHRQTGRKPSSDGRVRPSERDPRRGGVSTEPDRAGAPTTRHGAGGRSRPPSKMTGSRVQGNHPGRVRRADRGDRGERGRRGHRPRHRPADPEPDRLERL